MKAKRASFGKCQRCGKNPAYFMPLGLCDSCQKKFTKIPGQPGSSIRQKNVEKFFKKSYDQILKDARKLKW